jgi:Dockerin type I domain
MRILFFAAAVAYVSFAARGQTTCQTYSSSVAIATPVPGTTDVGNHCDDCGTTIALPFSYTLYDQTFTTVDAGANGHLTFGTASETFSITCLPTSGGTAAVTYVIAPYWTDQSTTSPGRGIFTSVTGVAPNRVFNIEYRTNYYNTTTALDYEVRLYEGQTTFDVIYGTVDADPITNDSALTLGVQRSNASAFTSVGCDATGGKAPPVSTNQRYHFMLVAKPKGDVNADGNVDVADVFYLINAFFAGGQAPICSGDVNNDSKSDLSDVFYLINYLFAGGPPPQGA